ncbi:uncharacterized protein LOC144640891 isoform X2 [Oculina patagonica]
MASCDNFVEQLWRKGKCANCFQSRDKHQNAAHRIGTHEDAGCTTANCKPQRALILPQSQRNQNVSASNVEKTDYLLKEGQGKKEHGLENGVNDIKSIASCTTHAILDTKDRCIVSDAVKKEQNSKPSVSNKPKPAPRPKPRPSSRAVEFGFGAISRDESPQEPAANVLNATIPLENTLGNSHNRPQCNANSLENSEEPVLSILDHDKELEETNKPSIKSVCETEDHEEGAMDVNDPENEEELSDLNDSDRVVSSNNAVVVDSFQTETDLSACKIVDEDESDLDEYVPMKSNIAFFDVESVHNELHETDVLEPNCEVNLDLREKASSDNQAIVACDSQTDEENSSGVLEFCNPLCVITNEMGDTNKATTQEPGDCDKLNDNPNKIIGLKSSTTEPFYVNRPSSSSSESTISSSQDSGYENTRKSIRSDSSHSASGNSTDMLEHVKPEEVSAADMPVVFSETGRSIFNIESSGTSSSSWGSSTWDSCSTSDFHETSSEAMVAEKVAGKFTANVDKPPSEALTTQTNNGQSIAMGSGPVYVNTTLKPVTRPYKVVDISSGVSVPDMESQNDAPPLPPKEKDLKKDQAEVLNHVYLEPSEETMITPEQGPSNEKKEVVPVPKVSSSPSLLQNQAPNSVTDKSPAVRRAPAPRPRSRVPSQFGTLPKPAPRMSRILSDTSVKVDSKEQKVAAATPPVASSPPPPKSPVSQPVTPVKSVSPSPSQPKAQPVRSSTFSGPHGTNSSPSPAKAASPKSTLRRAFATMKKLGGKKKNRHSKTIEISAPIAVNDEVPGFLAQKEAVRRRTMSEVNPLQAEQISAKEEQQSETAEPSNAGAISSPNPSVPAVSPTPAAPVDSPPVEGGSSRTSSPILQTEPGIGYQNFPLSKGGDTLERPKKPPRVAKVVKPLQHSDPTPDEATTRKDEEPTYLQPNEDELTLKVETALANLTDAEILAEALSRVEQEMLGPLPAIPRSRHVHFRCKNSDGSKTSVLDKPELPKRPVRVVSPTLINGSGEKSDHKSRPPRLPSRPPNTKPSGPAMRERSHSLETRTLDKHKHPVVRSRSLSTNANVLEKRYNKILKLQMQTLEEMIHSWKEELLPDAELDLSDTRWSDYEICGDVLDVQCPGAVLLPVKCALLWEGNKKLLAKVQYPVPPATHVLEGSPYKLDMRMCEALPYHVNISRVLTHFTDDVSGDAIGRPDCDSYETLVTITDQVPCETVADFLKRTKEEHASDPESYEKKICLLILQLLRALDHLHREAVVHRDLKAENLFLLDCGLLVVTNFQHALHQPKSTQPSPFILSRSVSSHLGGNLEHLPPEVVNAPEDVDLLNYEDCDTFAAGCLVYEFLHRANPFAVNPNLVEQSYDQTDLPPIPFKSRFSKGLGTIARQLLQRHPQERLAAGEAIQMLQVLLWGPKQLDDDSLENAIGDWLETERAHTVAMIARNQIQKSCNSDEFIETYMKCQFLVDASVETISYIYQQLDLDQ